MKAKMYDFEKDYFSAFPNHTKISKKIIYRCHEIGYIYWSRRYAITNSWVAKRFINRKIMNLRRVTGLELNLKNVGVGCI